MIKSRISLFLMLILCQIYLCQVTNPPQYVAIPTITTGKSTPIFQLSTQSQGWVPYTITFIKPLTSMATKQAILSLISFQSLPANEFSFNTTIKSMSLSTLQIQVKILGNSYFNLLSLQYLAVTYSVGIPYVISTCYLCSQWQSGFNDQKFITFKKVDLTSVTEGRFEVWSFISGVKMYNNFEKTKMVQVYSEMKKGSSFIHQTVRTKGKTVVEWVCMSTFVMDFQYRSIFSVFNGVYIYGNATVNYGNSVLNWPQVTEDFNSVDLMFFGLSQIVIGTQNKNQKFIFHSERGVDFKNDAQVTSFGGTVAYYFLANKQCPNPTTPYFNYVNRLCYDTCPTQTYKQDTPVKNCYKCHYSCRTCLSSPKTQCSSCEPLHFRTLTSGVCKCNVGYVDVGVKICEKCEQFVQYCIQCSTSDVCTVCDFGLVFDSVSKRCICPNGGFFVQASSLCLPYPGCIVADLSGGAQQCQTCNDSQNFIKNTASQCQCDTKYYPNFDKCLPICGDGINLVQNDPITCDDGNNLSNDGCDPNCLVQSLYGCTNDINGVSTCSLKYDIQMKHIYTERIRYQNSAILVFQITQFLSQFQDDDFNLSASSTIPNEKIQTFFDKENSLIKVQVWYNQSIQSTDHNISITFDPKKVSIPQKTLSISLKGANLQLTYDSKIQLRKAMKVFNIVLSCLIVGIFLLFCALQQKMAGTQLLLSSQLVFFTIFSIGNNSAIQSLTGLKYLIGYNDIFEFQMNPNNYQVSQILPLGQFKQFILNFNFMVGAQVLSLFLMLFFKAPIWRLQHLKSRILKNQIIYENGQNMPPLTISQIKKRQYSAEILFKKYKNRVYYPISLICLLPSVFYFVIQSNSTDINNKFYWNKALNIGVSFLSLMISVGFLNYLYQQSQKKRPAFTFFRKAIFYPFHLIFMYFLAVFIYSIGLKFEIGFYIIFVCQIGLLIYRILNKPYPKWLTIQSVDSLVKHVITIICMILLFVSRFILGSAQEMYAAVSGLLLVSVILTISRYVYTAFCRSARRKKSAEINLLNPAQDDGSEKDLYHGSQASEEEQSSSDESSSDGTDNINKKYSYNKQENLFNGQIQDTNKSSNVLIHSEAGNSSDQNEDELTRIKRKLRLDLKQKRGLLNNEAKKAARIKKQ